MDHLTYQYDTDIDLDSVCGYAAESMPDTLTRAQVRRLLLEHGALDGDWLEFIGECGDHTTYPTKQINDFLGY